jgi:tape measure domain-containing protein
MAGKINTQLVIDGKNNTRAAFDQVNKSLDGMNKQLAEAGTLFVSALSGGALLAAGRAFIDRADQVKLMNARLKLATGTQEEFNTAQKELQRIAKAAQAPLDSLVTLYGRISRPLKEAGRSQSEILKVTEAVAQSFRISGASAQEAENGVIQFAQALGSGALRGDEFNSVAEQAPRLMQALADGLGVPTGALKEMAAQGELTASVVTDALLSQLPKITEEAQKIPETLSGAVTNLENQVTLAVGRLDELTGASTTAAGSVNRLAGAMSGISSVKSPGWLDKFLSVFKLLSNTQVFDKAVNLLLFGPSTESVDAEAQQYEYREALFDLHTKEMQLLRAKEVESAQASQDHLVKAAAQGAKALESAEKKANSQLEKVRAERLAIEQRYKEALAGLNGEGVASYGAANSLKVSARQALSAGDVAGAQAKAQAALKMLQEIAAAGGNTYGFGGFIQELQAIELAANDIEQTRAEDKIKAIKAEMLDLKVKAATLEDMPVSVKMDDAALTAVKKAIDDLASTKIMIEVGAQYDFSQPYTLVDPGPAPPKFATGGHVRGPGTGTSDSIMARLSNGEYVMRAAAVAKFGPAFFDRLNGLQIPRFAEGGLIGAVSSAGPVSRGTVNLTLPGGESYSLFAEGEQFDQILRRTSTKFGRTHK